MKNPYIVYTRIILNTFKGVRLSEGAMVMVPVLLFELMFTERCLHLTDNKSYRIKKYHYLKITKNYNI